MKVVKNRFEQLIKARGLKTKASHQIAISLEAFDKLAEWAIADGIYDKQMFFVRVSEWLCKQRLPRATKKRHNIDNERKFRDIEDLLKDIHQHHVDKSTKVSMLKLNDDAYQVIIRWAVQQGATGNEEMSVLFSDSIMKASLPGHRGPDKASTPHSGRPSEGALKKPSGIMQLADV
ncbi:MAG: hypothetical protein OEY36_00655 [Gammaproteobacteria bacterium]|nr:hypothetical protein [Gammaproteobacteria bacterium]